ADAAGADAVVFAGESIDPWHPKVVRATTGSLFHLPVAVAPTLDASVDAARAAGLRVLAADVHGEDLDPAADVLAGPVAWLFGNEARGLNAEERALADGALRLPIYGAAESLNLATAASVLLYQTAFAQRGLTRPGRPV
ncbi:TrmH family RNA methyltransferase, partial [Leucobacter soli]